MRIEFLKINIEGFMSIGNASIDLAENGLVLVSGKNTNPADNSKSNGSGKSSIFEAIFYAATGATIRGSKNVVNRNYPRGCKLELTIKRGKDIFNIIRSRNHHEIGTKVMLFMNDEDVSGKNMKDCDATIKQYIPEINWNIISSIVVLGQGLPHKLTGYSPSGRKQLLEDLSQTSHLVEGVRASLDTRKTLQTSTLKSLTTRISEISIEVATLQRVIQDIKGKLTHTISELDKDIFKYIEELNGLQEDAAILKADEEKFIESLVSKNRHKGEITSRINQFRYRQREIESKIQKISNNVCPTCNRLLDNCEELQSEKDSLQKELGMLESEIKVDIDLSSRIETELSQLTFSKSTISSSRTKVDAEIINTNSRLEHLSSTKTIIASAEADIANHNKRLENLNKESLELKPKQDELNLSLNSLGYLDRALSKEFKSYLLENVVEYLNKKITKYSALLFSENYISLVSNGNNLDIIVGEKDYESLSGGERQKADLCIQFALRDMLVNITGFSCNMIVLDEIFDNLDEKGCENLLKLLSQLFQDIDSVYVITHHSDISIPKDKELIVYKDFTNLSKVEERLV